ncbi:hypothetical protein JCM3766R1_003236 [Sporobolomyces carnicolor]
MAQARATAEQISRLGTLTTCEISDALIKLGHRTGGYVPDLERYSGDENRTVVGEAYTVEMVDAECADAPKLEGHFVDLATPDSVVFIRAPSYVKSASLGGLLATSLHRKGVRGVMISGRCRDLAELRALQLPVFARGHSTLGQSPFTRASRVQVPLEIPPDNSTANHDKFGTTTVHPFDIVVADLDGVVVVRPSFVDRVIELAKQGREVDDKCRKDLEDGRGVAETFKEHRGK